MAFRKGQSGNPRGRKRGAQNRVTRAFKEAATIVFYELGGTRHLLGWARKQPAEFYRILARMAPPGVPVAIGPLEGTLVDQGRSVIAAMGSGKITPEQATTIMQALSAQARVVEVEELERRVKALEEQQNGKP